MWYEGTYLKFGVKADPLQGNRKICGPCWDAAHRDCELCLCECFCRERIADTAPRMESNQIRFAFPEDEPVELPRVRHGK